MVLHRSGLKTGIGYGFQGNYRSRWTHCSFQFQMSKKERERFYIYIYLYMYFLFCANLSISDDTNFLGRQVWKWVWKMTLIFWSEIGSGFKEPRGTPPLRIPRSTPIPRRTVVKTFHELEWCYLLYPRFGKYAGGKKRIEFLIHKSWQIEKVIGQVSVRTDISAFFYHVFTNKRLHSCPFCLS